jgi:hypothetical protein
MFQESASEKERARRASEEPAMPTPQRAQAKERDYSHRSLYDKLGIPPAARVALLGPHDDWFAAELRDRLSRPPSQTLRAKYDAIILRLDERRDLERIARAAAHLLPHGALWMLYPKGRGATPSDAEVRSAGLAAGLVDNKISAYSATHTATRYVIPLARR